MLPSADSIEEDSIVMLSQRDAYICSAYNSTSMCIADFTSCLADLVSRAKGLGSTARCSSSDFSPALHSHPSLYNEVSVHLRDTDSGDDSSSDLSYVPGYRYPVLVDNSSEVLGYVFLDGTLSPLSS